MRDDTSTTISVPGFDDDLVDPKVLKKVLGSLSATRLMAGLRSARVAVRANSAVALGLGGDLDEGTCMALAVLLRDESAAVRGAAARGLRGAAEPSFALAKLLLASADTNSAVVADVAATIHGFGVAALPELIRGLQRDPTDADTQVIPHVVAFGAKAEKLVIAALTHDDERVRANALATLIQLGVATLVAQQDAIRGMINDPSHVVRALVTEALGAMYRRQRATTLRVHEPPSPGFGGASISEAQAKKLAAAADEETLLHFSRDGRDVARRNAWLVLALRGKAGPSVTALAAVATRDRDPHVRAHAARVLGSGHPDHMIKAVLALVVLLGDNQDVVVTSAETALDALGKVALAALLTTMDQRDGGLAQLHTRALVRFGQSAGAALKTKVGDISPVTRTLAREALAQIGGKALIACAAGLVDGLRDPWDQARAAAAVAIGPLVPAHVKEPEAVIERLKELYADDAYLIVRDAAERALRDIADRA